MDLSQAIWLKSASSGVNGCVEVAFVDDGVAVRNSRDPAGAVLLFSLVEWEAFLRRVHNGEFDGSG